MFILALLVDGVQVWAYLYLELDDAILDSLEDFLTVINLAFDDNLCDTALRDLHQGKYSVAEYTFYHLDGDLP